MGERESGWASHRRTPSPSLGPWGARTVRRLEPTKRSETSYLVPNAPRHGRRMKHLTPATAFPPVHVDPTDDTPISSSDSSSSSSASTQAQSKIPRHVNVQAQAQTDSRSQQQTMVGTNVLAGPTSNVLAAATQEAQLWSSTPTKRAA